METWWYVHTREQPIEHAMLWQWNMKQGHDTQAGGTTSQNSYNLPTACWFASCSHYRSDNGCTSVVASHHALLLLAAIVAQSAPPVTAAPAGGWCLMISQRHSYYDTAAQGGVNRLLWQTGNATRAATYAAAYDTS